MTSSNDIYLIIKSKEIDKFDTLLQKITEQKLVESSLIQIVNAVVEMNNSFMAAYTRTWQLELEYVKLLIEKYKINVQFTNNYLLKALCTYGAESIIRYLITEKGIDPNVFTDFNADIIVSLAARNCISTFELIMEHGVNINQFSKYKLITIAASYKCKDFCEFLIKNNYQYDNDEFISVVSNDMVPVVKIMLESGNINIRHGNDKAIMLSIANKYVDMTKLLLDYGATIMPIEMNNDIAQLYELFKFHNLSDEVIVSLLTMKKIEI